MLFDEAEAQIFDFLKREQGNSLLSWCKSSICMVSEPIEDSELCSGRVLDMSSAKDNRI